MCLRKGERGVGKDHPDRRSRKLSSDGADGDKEAEQENTFY